MTYTKGKWRVSPILKSGAEIIIRIGAGDCDWGVGEFIKVLPNSSKDSQVEATHIANANLISAAPNMYKTLKSLLDERSLSLRWRLKIGQVLAKAEGRE
jgi:hypothetical protein